MSRMSKPRLLWGAESSLRSTGGDASTSCPPGLLSRGKTLLLSALFGLSPESADATTMKWNFFKLYKKQLLALVAGVCIVHILWIGGVAPAAVRHVALASHLRGSVAPSIHEAVRA